MPISKNVYVFGTALGLPALLVAYEKLPSEYRTPLIAAVASVGTAIVATMVYGQGAPTAIARPARVRVASRSTSARGIAGAE